MQRLFYVSTASPAFEPAELGALVAAASDKNARRGITGALVFNGINFGQVLEGEAGEIDALMNAIRADKRHDGVIVVSQKDVPGRKFDGWSMRHIEGLEFDALMAALDVEREPALA